MFGIALIALAECFAEASISIGRYEVKHRKETLYAMAFLSAAWTTVFLAIYTLTWGEFRFTLESLPTFTARLILESLLLFVSLNALIKADRSTFAFLRIITIPLLLAADIALGYTVSITEMLGISFIVLALIILFLNHGLSRRGKFLSILSGLIAVATVTLYKYDITHFNSVEAEQILTYATLIILIIVVAKIHTGENVVRHMFQPLFLAQSLFAGIATALFSFAFLFAPASVITSAKRAFETFTAVISGRSYFKEKHFIVKVVAATFVAAGIVIMAI